MTQRVLKHAANPVFVLFFIFSMSGYTDLLPNLPIVLPVVQNTDNLFLPRTGDTENLGGKYSDDDGGMVTLIMCDNV
ncbi:hypothetical protein JOM56_001002 [Amanita muscaria]